LAWAASWIMRPGSNSGAPLASAWEHWDASLLRHIAQYGYSAPQGSPEANLVAFFPGYPLLLRTVHVIIPSWIGAEIAIASIASFFAILGLVRLAEDYQAGSGANAALFFIVAPAAVFLSVGYTEPLFLAFALPSWLAARRGSWATASFLATAACAVRVNGLFLLAGLLLIALRTRTGRRRSAFVYLAIPVLPVVAYELYLRFATGDWLAWQHAEAAGWGRALKNPVTTFKATWTAAFGHEFHAPVAFIFQLELGAAAVLLATTIILAINRRWPEFVYCSLTVAALMAGTWYESVPRALMLAWPLWCGLGSLALRYKKAGFIWLGVSAPLMCVTALLYASGNWAA